MNFIWLIKWNFFCIALGAFQAFDVCFPWVHSTSCTFIVPIQSQLRKRECWCDPSNQDLDVNIKFVCLLSMIIQYQVPLITECTKGVCTSQSSNGHSDSNYLPQKKKEKKSWPNCQWNRLHCSLHNRSQRDTICLVWLIIRNFALTRNGHMKRFDDCYDEYWGQLSCECDPPQRHPHNFFPLLAK